MEKEERRVDRRCIVHDCGVGMRGGFRCGSDYYEFVGEEKTFWIALKRVVGEVQERGREVWYLNFFYMNEKKKIYIWD
jgi:hypothetical protein